MSKKSFSFMSLLAAFSAKHLNNVVNLTITDENGVKLNFEGVEANELPEKGTKVTLEDGATPEDGEYKGGSIPEGFVVVIKEGVVDEIKTPEGEDGAEKEELIAENAELKEEVENLKEQITNMKNDFKALNREITSHFKVTERKKAATKIDEGGEPNPNAPKRTPMKK